VDLMDINEFRLKVGEKEKTNYSLFLKAEKNLNKKKKKSKKGEGLKENTVESENNVLMFPLHLLTIDHFNLFKIPSLKLSSYYFARYILPVIFVILLLCLPFGILTFLLFIFATLIIQFGNLILFHPFLWYFVIFLTLCVVLPQLLIAPLYLILYTTSEKVKITYTNEFCKTMFGLVDYRRFLNSGNCAFSSSLSILQPMEIYPFFFVISFLVLLVSLMISRTIRRLIFSLISFPFSFFCFIFFFFYMYIL
jgi:hypothetical protein